MNQELNLILKEHELDADAEIVIRKAGHYEKVKNHQIHRKGTDCIEEAIVLFCIEGSGWLQTKNDSFQVEKGMIIFCDCNAPHGYGTNPNNPWSLIWVHFTGPFLESFSKALCSEHSCRVLPMNNFFKLFHSFSQIIELLDSPDDYLNRLTAYTYLKVCLCEVLLQKHQRESPYLASQRFIQESIQVMETQLSQHLSLDQLSKQIGLSKYYFSRQFKLTTGLSPMAYFNQLKMQKACTLLISNTYLIQEISAMLGFSTPYYFSEIFKQFTGFSPRDYRKLQVIKY